MGITVNSRGAHESNRNGLACACRSLPPTRSRSLGYHRAASYLRVVDDSGAGGSERSVVQ